MIAIAARGGTDPTTNPSLDWPSRRLGRLNSPNANIQRAIDRINDKNAAALRRGSREGYGPGGVGIIIETATDNKNRTNPEGPHCSHQEWVAPMADSGSVMFQFARKGVIRVAASGEEALLTVL